MKEMLILETSPAGPLDIHKPLRKHKRADFRSVTHDNKVRGCWHNPGSTWGANRNYLLSKAAEKDISHKWYMFTDYDVSLTSRGDPDVITELLHHLNAWNPAVAFTWYDRQGSPPIDAVRSGAFCNNMLAIYHWSVMPLFFPLPVQFGGFWDCASFSNVLASVLFPSGVMQIPSVVSRSLVSSDYAANQNTGIGRRAMQKCYDWQRQWIHQDMPASVHQAKAEAISRRVSPEPAAADISYFNMNNIAGKIDVSHEWWRERL